jgi:hypothetical protein
MQAAYKTAGIINRVVAEIIKILNEQDPWLEYVLAKTLYQLWIAKLGDREMESNPEFWVDSKEMVAFMVQPRFHQLGFPDLTRLKNVRAPTKKKKKKGSSKKKAPPKKPPTQQILEMCAKVKTRVERNRDAMEGSIPEEELDLDDEPTWPDDFYDDSDLDDVLDIDDFDDDEFDAEAYGDGYFSDEVSRSIKVRYKKDGIPRMVQ